MKKKNKALVLMNMGGPRSKDELKLFLNNMFRDKNIVSMKSNFLRYCLAKIIVLSRLNKAWENYVKIGGASPLNAITTKLVDKLNAKLENYEVKQVMRYTPPFAQEACDSLQALNIEEVVLLPLYPQYSTTTTKSSLEDFMNVKNFNFRTRIIEPFYKNDLFNTIIIEDIKKSVLSTKGYNLIFSAHGLPQKIVDAGDPYQEQVVEHVSLLIEKLKKEDLEFSSINLAYQSKVGPLKWITPSLDDKLKEFKNERVLIYPIAFIIDNSETMFELDIEYREIAKSHGISDYKVCPCVNDSDEFVSFIEELVKEK